VKRVIRNRRTFTSQSGLSLAEILVVASIVAVVVALSIPSFSRALDNARLKSAAQQLSGIYEDARARAAQNNTTYEVLVVSLNTGSLACIDLNGDGRCGPTEPQTLFPAQVVLNNSGPPPLGTSILGFDPQNTEKSHMAPVAGLAWNSRGVPCERDDPAIACAGMNGWVQYLQLPRAGGDVLYAAVTVSPTGRVRSWTYILSGNGNGKWF
jgi:type II secretory pathway pseudopilin PulG